MKENYDKYKEIFYKFNLLPGRLISFSKSFYRELYPKNFVVFNANIIVSRDGKIWWGDLDLTKEQHLLKQISKKIKKELFVLQEMDARFGVENLKFSDLKKKAVWSSEKGFLVKVN